jgi:WD40 repeat protein
VAANNIARWDAATSSWQALGSGVNRTVSALAVGPDGSLYAGGYFSSAGGIVAARIARWDATTASWHPLGDGIGGGEFDGWVYALAIGADGSLYAGGEFDMAGGLSANHIARWDGVAWRPLGAGVDGGQYTRVSALAFGPDGSLYVGGDFWYAGGTPAGNIARWDSKTSSWHNMQSAGTIDLIRALAVDSSGSLFLGGDFLGAGGIWVNHIARWDPATATCHALGSGMDNRVNALLAAPDGSIYAGGIFTTAGGLPSSAIAQWEPTPPTAVDLISLDTAVAGAAPVPGWLTAALAAIALCAGAVFVRRDS